MRFDYKTFSSIEDAGICKVCGCHKDTDCQCPQGLFGSITEAEAEARANETRDAHWFIKELEDGLSCPICGKMPLAFVDDAICCQSNGCRVTFEPEFEP